MALASALGSRRRPLLGMSAAIVHRPALFAVTPPLPHLPDPLLLVLFSENCFIASDQRVSLRFFFFLIPPGFNFWRCLGSFFFSSGSYYEREGL
uniref:Putative secreted protein n=1 Tax=Ixodes ricinus TaxID=34613 RepID=A0A6B0U336_IXORI